MGLKLQGISKTWQGFRLQDISLNVQDDEYFILLGPTGSGKTLLLETIMGFHRPDHGKILLNNTDITTLPPEKRRIGYVAQNSMLFPHMKVAQNVEFGLKMQRIEESVRKRKVREVLEATGIEYLAQRYPSGLSGGEKQKVALARVLAIDSETILLDEPLSALDAEAARDLRAELKRIHQTGKTILHVTHSQIEGFSLGESVGIMRQGTLVQTGKMHEVFAKPNSEFSAKFLGYENVFKANLKNRAQGVVEVEGVEVKTAGSAGEGAGFVAVRPEDIAVHIEPVVADEERNVLAGEIVDCIDQGSFVALTVEAKLTLQTLMTKSAFLESSFQTGQQVWLSFKKETVKIIP
ncbi:MAG: ABC transporter ATP-binding protein [Candidatus Bathyarchaeota archaeon]|nr:ABC transporter ATP-binding protein [Candidatus Bathyarchaeota archaeon]